MPERLNRAFSQTLPESGIRRDAAHRRTKRMEIVRVEQQGVPLVGKNFTDVRLIWRDDSATERHVLEELQR